MDPVNVRNLEQIQEDDGRVPRSRLGTWVLAASGCAALALVALLSSRGGAAGTEGKADALGALVASAQREPRLPADRLDPRDASFAGLLSDQPDATTALAAVTDDRGNLVKPVSVAGAASTFALPPGSPSAPPEAGDRLPVFPLPVGTLVTASAVTTQPKDALTALATRSGEQPAGSPEAPAGMEGKYQLQVASFDKADDADKLVSQLRKRGHSAYRQAAYVAGRGLWHRVRLGPFGSKYDALLYRKKFEHQERMAPFVVAPEKAKLEAEKTRAAPVGE